MRFPAFIVFALLLTGLSGGCNSTPAPRDYTQKLARFFLEAANEDGTPVVLPKSNVHIAVNSKPVLTEGDIANVELVQVELGQCLMFQLTATASRDFYRLSVTHQGRRLVLLVDGVALGARRIDGPISDGTVFVFAEVAEADLPALVNNLKKTSIAVQRELSRK
jgi:hypothetical protein